MYVILVLAGSRHAVPQLAVAPAKAVGAYAII